MKLIVKTSVLASALLLAACGGGGGSAGTSVYGNGSSGSTATNGTGVSVVSTGIPNQRSMSISVDKYALDWGVDGDKATITVRVSDTAGNPIPDGTKVQFSVSGGQVLTSCNLTGIKGTSVAVSSCSVDFVTQAPRPKIGKIAVLAWVEGEEAYIDTNGNGKYDPGEPFYEGGQLFRDDNLNGVYDPGIDTLVVSNSTSGNDGIGGSACHQDASVFPSAADKPPLSVPNTCDGVWGKTLVRASVAMAESYASSVGIVQTSATTVQSFSVTPDGVAVSAPSGSTLSVVNAPTGCTLSVSPDTVPSNFVDPVTHTVSGTGCTGQTVGIKITSGTYSSTTNIVAP